MKPDPNYPRWMYHRSRDPVLIHSEAEEAALGPEWSRKVFASLPREEKPEKIPGPEPEEEPEEEHEPEPEEPVEQPAAQTVAPPVKPKRGRPAAHKPPHKSTAHKRG